MIHLTEDQITEAVTAAVFDYEAEIVSDPNITGSETSLVGLILDRHFITKIVGYINDQQLKVGLFNG
jgi:hypothetical protein